MNNFVLKLHDEHCNNIAYEFCGGWLTREYYNYSKRKVAVFNIPINGLVEVILIEPNHAEKVIAELKLAGFRGWVTVEKVDGEKNEALCAFVI